MFVQTETISGGQHSADTSNMRTLLDDIAESQAQAKCNYVVIIISFIVIFIIIVIITIIIIFIIIV